jgi:hypothetical protein
MRNMEIGRDFDGVAEQNEVEVERACSAGVWALASAGVLDGQQPLENGAPGQ